MRFEALADEHLKFLWAAYKLGEFRDLFEEDLEAVEFTTKAIETLNSAMVAGTELVIAFADTPKGNIPVVLITIHSNFKIAWPHAGWMPWASPRNKVEIGVKFFRDLKRTHLGLVTATPEDQPYFRHLAKYGLLRTVGKIRDFNMDPGNDVMLFQTVT